MSKEPLIVSARATEAAAAYVEGQLAGLEGASVIATAIRNGDSDEPDPLADAFARFERDLLEEVKARIEGLRKYVKHHGLCGFIGGYGHCTCGLDEALAAIPTSSDGGENA